MNKNKINRYLAIILSFMMFLIMIPNIETSASQPVESDLDLLVDLEVTFILKSIRALDTIDRFSDPNFYVKVTINSDEYTSPVYANTRYVHNPNWSATSNVPDDIEWVDIKIELYHVKRTGRAILCDISDDYTTSNEQYTANIRYSLKTGRWKGSDWNSVVRSGFDPSGYGRLNGCDDGSIKEEDRDCELYFDIVQNDYDGDGIPYWTEVNMYRTDPYIDNRGDDADGDLVPVEWEHRWGYDPFVWNDHIHLDPDDDGLTNYEEYLTSQWGSDPHRRDIFLELDQMMIGPNGEGNLVPKGSKDLLKDPFHKRNIVFHIDDGCMGGGELLPFDDTVTWPEIQEIYWEYFMHKDPDNWRRGVFHYGIVTYHTDIYHGFTFPSIVENRSIRVDSFQISTKELEVLPFKYPLFRMMIRKSISKEKHREIVYAAAMMHETGHVLGIYHGNTPGCDNQTGKYIWQKDWWFWRNYHSVMNYGWMYSFVDYSDGSNGKNDFNDWERIDLKAFKQDHTGWR
ncbi:MAG: hypothetical protein QXS02_03100 [Candidatus Thermoplasmatota archaeon]